MNHKFNSIHRIDEMARVGEFDGCEISVFTNEGHVPHFHFYDKQTGRRGCIRIDKADYFFHGKYKDTLDRDERYDLQRWLKSTYTGSKHFNGTVFEFIVALWNINNDMFKIDEDTPMPDYTNI